jgi:hypothetical protein
MLENLCDPNLGAITINVGGPSAGRSWPAGRTLPITDLYDSILLVYISYRNIDFKINLKLFLINL